MPIPNSRRQILRYEGEKERMWKNHAPNSVVGFLFQSKEKGKGWEKLRKSFPSTLECLQNPHSRI